MQLPLGKEPKYLCKVFRHSRITKRNNLQPILRVDVLVQAYFNACLILLQGSDVAASVPGGIGAPSAGLNPYRMASDAVACLGRSSRQCPSAHGFPGGITHASILAIALLKTYAYSYSEIDTSAAVFQFTRFNGQPEVIRRGDFSS